MGKKKKETRINAVTPKELYDFAVANGMENKALNIYYECDDCWYDYDGIAKEKPYIKDGKIYIHINDCNY